MSVRPAIAGEPTAPAAESPRTDSRKTAAPADKPVAKGSNDQNAKPPASLTGDFVRRAKEFAQSQQVDSPKNGKQTIAASEPAVAAAVQPVASAKPAARMAAVAKAPSETAPSPAQTSAQTSVKPSVQPAPARKGFGRRTDGAKPRPADRAKAPTAAVAKQANAITKETKPNKAKSADAPAVTDAPVANAIDASPAPKPAETETIRPTPRLVVSASTAAIEPAEIIIDRDPDDLVAEKPPFGDTDKTTSILMSAGTATDAAKLFPTTEDILRGAIDEPEQPKRKRFRFAEELAIFAAAFFVVCAGYIYWMLS